MKDNAAVKDKIAIRVAQAPRAFCAKCGTGIYYYNQHASGLRRFAPIDGGPQWDGTAVCWKCGNDFTARLEGRPVIKTDRGYL